MTQLMDPAARPRRAGRMLRAYFGHHKCASTWVADIVRDVCASSGMRQASVHNPRGFDADLRAFVEKRNVEFLIYANANRAHVAGLGDFRGFHVIRDPRDIVVSSYFSHLYSHPTDDWPELADHRRELQSVDKTQGIYVVIDFLAGVLDDIATWDYADPRILELKMEELLKAPEEELVRAMAFVGAVREEWGGVASGLSHALANARRQHRRLVPFRISTLPASVTRDAVRRHSFAAKTNGRPVGTEDVASHYRKGVAGDWINHFDAGHKAYFNERYGELLVRLGYESSLDW